VAALCLPRRNFPKTDLTRRSFGGGGSASHYLGLFAFPEDYQQAGAQKVLLP